MLNDQGGASINVENGETSPTLRAQSHQHEPVVCYGVNCSGGSDAQVDSELYGCLTASANSSGNNKAAVAYTLDGRNARVNEEISGTLQAKANGGFSYNCVNPVAYTLKIRGGVNVDSHGRSAGKGALIQEDLSATLAAAQDQTLFQPVPYQDATGCLSPGAHPGSYNGQDAYNDMLITEQKCYGISSYDSNSMKSANPNSGIYEADTSRTLDLNGGSPACNQGGVAVCEPQPLCIEMTSTKNTVVDDGISPTLTARMGTGGNQVNAVCEKAVRWIVRRLTPKECERLQGYDLICGFDGWTDIGEWVDSKGKRHKEANSPRYKALGNSIALPFWHQMFQRMAKYIPEDATLGSLFDGIGWFPLCWESIHGKGTARWASEIEEFPIAVTKIRFPEEESGETATTDEPTRNESDSESVAYTQGQFANYREGVGTLRSSGGDLGGGSETLILTKIQ